MNGKWLLVLVAGFFEVGWAAGLKHADSPLEWVLTVIAIVTSFALLLYCSSQLPATTVYAAFVGLGSAGTVLLEMTVFGVPFSWIKVGLIVVLLIGIIGLKTITVEKEVKTS